jgi:hypothetical protein
MQDTINPQSNQTGIPLGLNMNIAGPLIKGIVKEVINGIYNVPVI